MSYPILYSPMETRFDNNGIGILGSCVACEVIEEANGMFELAMQYPMDGIHFAGIVDRAIIKVRIGTWREPQLFRVYAISKPMSGIVTVSAEHISYDLSGIPVSPFTASDVGWAMNGLKNNAVVDCPFSFWTDKSTNAEFKATVPGSIRSLIGGIEGSILDVYGGELEFDNYAVKLHNRRGENRGVSIRYGKNLTDIRQDQNCANVATGIYPYWSGTIEETEVLVELPEKIIKAEGNFNFVKIKTIDLTNDFEDGEFEGQPTVEQLREHAQKYLKEHKVGVPDVSLSVSFAQLEQSDEYKGMKLLEQVELFDEVNVEFPALGVSATATAVELLYNVITDRVERVVLGSVKANISKTIANQQQQIQSQQTAIDKKPSKTFVQEAVESSTKTILGANGGSVRFLDDDGDGEPDTLYIADDPDPTQAVEVWRFNHKGWGASKNGYNGPFGISATFEEGIVADFIKSGTLYGLLFKAGIIESFDGRIHINLGDENAEPVFNTGISTNGLTVRADAVGIPDLFQIAAHATISGESAYVQASLNSGKGYNLLNVGETFTSNSSGVTCDMTEEKGTCHANTRVVDGDARTTYTADSGAQNGPIAEVFASTTSGACGIDLKTAPTVIPGYFRCINGVSVLSSNQINGLTVYWQDNGNGTYTLMGRGA